MMDSPGNIYGPTLVLAAKIKELEDGTCHYSLSLGNIEVLRSIRTFLKREEAIIEVEWLLQKLGCTTIRQI